MEYFSVYSDAVQFHLSGSYHVHPNCALFQTISEPWNQRHPPPIYWKQNSIFVIELSILYLLNSMPLVITDKGDLKIFCKSC